MSLRFPQPYVGPLNNSVLSQAVLPCRVRDSYITTLESLALPISDETLAAHHEAASAAARQQFQAEKFGNDLTTGLGSLQDMLQASLDKEFL